MSFEPITIVGRGTEPEAELMPCEPGLPPVPDPAGPAPAAVVPGPDTGEVPQGDGVPVVAGGGDEPPALAYLSLVARLHEEFVTRQVEVHDQFLRLSQAAAALVHPGADPAPPHPGRRFDRAELEGGGVPPRPADAGVADAGVPDTGVPDTGVAESRVEVLDAGAVHWRDRASPHGAGPLPRGLSRVRDWWRQRLSTGPGWPGEDLCYGLAEQFLDHVIYTDPEASVALRGRGCLYLANHQVGVESLVFAVMASALAGTQVLAVTKEQHPQSWVGRFVHDAFSYPGVSDPGLMAFVDRADPAGAANTFASAGADLAAGRSVLVHVDGTRARSCRQLASQFGDALLDMALAAGAPVVPVRFTRGLPVAPAPHRLEFPVGYGRQEYWVGPPLRPADLAAMPYLERKATVLGAINGLGPGPGGDRPAEADPAFAARVEDWVHRTGAAHEDAVVYTTLAGRAEPTPAISLLLEGAQAGGLVLAGDPVSRWLGQLARRLYGPHGPEVVQR